MSALSDLLVMAYNAGRVHGRRQEARGQADDDTLRVDVVRVLLELVVEIDPGDLAKPLPVQTQRGSA